MATTRERRRLRSRGYAPFVPKGRLEAFSDGVIAILITIMVLELHTPAGTSWHALGHELPALLAYVLSFVYLGIYWNNHHHMLAAVSRVSGTALWANLHLLFWLSLIPFTTAWMSEHRFPSVPTAVYGIVLLAAAIAYLILQTMLVRAEGERSRLRAALGADVKGKISALLYCLAIALAFTDRWLALALYVAVALIWLVPDRRVERHLTATPAEQSEEARSASG
jgi:TMEM175 potassium channel family protein